MKDVLITAGLSALASIFNLSLVEGGLRISLGIIVLIAILEYKKDLPIFLTSLLSGIGVFIVRVIMEGISVGFSALTLHTVFSLSLEIIFYLSYGLIYFLIVRNDTSVYKSPLILLLMLCDFGANSVEYLSRYFMLSSTVQTIGFMTIFLAAFIRSSFIWIITKFILKVEESEI